MKYIALLLIAIAVAVQASEHFSSLHPCTADILNYCRSEVNEPVAQRIFSYTSCLSKHHNQLSNDCLSSNIQFINTASTVKKLRNTVFNKLERIRTRGDRRKHRKFAHLRDTFGKSGKHGRKHRRGRWFKKIFKAFPEVCREEARKVLPKPDWHKKGQFDPSKPRETMIDKFNKIINEKRNVLSRECADTYALSPFYTCRQAMVDHCPLSDTIRRPMHQLSCLKSKLADSTAPITVPTACSDSLRALSAVEAITKRLVAAYKQRKDVKESIAALTTKEEPTYRCKCSLAGDMTDACLQRLSLRAYNVLKSTTAFGIDVARTGDEELIAYISNSDNEAKLTLASIETKPDEDYPNADSKADMEKEKRDYKKIRKAVEDELMFMVGGGIMMMAALLLFIACRRRKQRQARQAQALLDAQIDAGSDAAAPPVYTAQAQPPMVVMDAASVSSMYPANIPRNVQIVQPQSAVSVYPGMVPVPVVAAAPLMYVPPGGAAFNYQQMNESHGIN